MTIEQEIKQPTFRSIEHKTLINVLFTGNWLENRIKRFLKSHQLTLQQFNILRILRGQHPNAISINLIKERMLDPMSDVSRIVERLRKNGLVERNSCPEDRRSVNIILTPLGLEIIQNMDQYDDYFDNLLERLSPEESQQLNALLDKIRSVESD